MSVEQQLRPAFDNLAARLRRDIERHLDAAVQELVEHADREAQAADAQREAALAEAVRTAREAAALDAQAQHQTVVEQHLSALSETDARHRAELLEAEARHRDTLDSAQAQHREALDALGARYDESVSQSTQQLRAQAEEHRTLFEEMTREQETQLARAIEETERRIIASLQAADLSANHRLVESFRAIDMADSLSGILNVLASAVSTEAARSAIFLSGQAQVKSWRTHGFSGDHAASVEMPMADAGIVAAALESKAPASTGGDGGDDVGSQAPVFAALPDDRAAVAVPMIVNDEVVAVVYADQGQTGDIDRASWPAIVELLARHASRSLEAVTAHRLAATLGSGATRPRVVSKPADVVSRVPEVARVPAVPGELDEASAEAQRYARRLVEDLRAAHDAEVQAGVRDGDLMVRLGGPIATAWSLYEAKVPESIRNATNFFHAEMVRTLAGGNASLLTPKP